MSAAVAAALAAGPPPPQFTGTTWENPAASALEHAPYLKRLIARREDILNDIDDAWPQRMVDAAIASADAIACDPPAIEEAMQRLRTAKDQVHLATAIADLSGAWALERVTGAITDFADAALRAAVSVAASELARRGEIVLAENLRVPGFALIAMGKMGARELNYSSDIDFSVFFDAELLTSAGAREPRVAAVRLVAPLVRTLEEVTAEGYVFRTDLRLRPDPGSTPVAVSIASAELYYQNLGQNWERAAFIKARAAAGDIACGRAFLSTLEPFIWRKHLDFAAVEDVHSIKRQILSAHKSAELGNPVFDVKLGRGGIRDIELFAQTQQLILGGRNRELRKSGTLTALDALAAAGAIEGRARDALSEAYVFFREIEHRIQMLEDAQTHRLPSEPETRARVAALAGFSSLADFDAAVIEWRRVVADVDQQLFGGGESLADPLGSLSFTGVDDNPETLATIGKLGFSNPAFVSQTIRGWHHGRIRAMRSERARELLTRLTPRLLRALSGAGDPDHSFGRFAAFFAGLSAGVQVLALLDARPQLLDLLARVLSIAPRQADALSMRPALLDALIEPRFASPLRVDELGARARELRRRLADEVSFEARLNAARRFQREEAFRINVQLLDGLAGAQEVGAARADLAEACVVAMADAALAETERALGKQPGAFCVLALGKFGGVELSSRSDLDIMLVYDAPADAMNSGDFYTKLTQRLITALSAPTEEGALYDVDAKLRPSGSKGPVAVRLSSFERYYAEEAWTWELLALTRLRAAAGDAALGAKATEIASGAISRRHDREKVLRDVQEMRGLMQRERPARSIWDLKLTPGGFVDLEFIAQTLQLIGGAPELQAQNTGAALDKLVQGGMLQPEIGTMLRSAFALLSDLNQTLRVSVVSSSDPGSWPAPLKARLAEIGGVADFEALEARLRGVQNDVRGAFVRLIGAPGDGSAAPARSN
ncbi:MAG: bifunctional [glutamine synthetase] adenylyltransferase/[glutamine synthetase]-adenylyl-L-tyrosine phosphorylase [Proteobacteria bacterium]|nr:bifunctional [glutamine synthetase] adenylyltransferase/[glutamine synthetase]-adenylyl-L-tyrosine phosphorylase [Pseudomonadota bacterium]